MGYTAVPNEIIELQNVMSDPETKVTYALLRLTLGYQQTFCTVSYTELQGLTGLSRGGVASGVSAAAARGFFERVGRSGWHFLVYSVDQSSLPRRLNDNTNSLSVRPEQSTSQTNPVYPVDQNTPILKKKENIKENIYINGYLAKQELEAVDPFPEQTEKRQEMVSAISGEVKTTYAIGLNSDEFEQVADALIAQNLTPENIRGFSGWWSVNGFYKGKPALKTLVQEVGNYLGGVTSGSNGHSPQTTHPEIVIKDGLY
jgi:hypothetical protein